MRQFTCQNATVYVPECDSLRASSLKLVVQILFNNIFFPSTTPSGAELRSKIEAERDEAERLDEELCEIRAMREDLYSSDDKSDSADSDDDDDDEETLLATLNHLVMQNADLKVRAAGAHPHRVRAHYNGCGPNSIKREF